MSTIGALINGEVDDFQITRNQGALYKRKDFLGKEEDARSHPNRTYYFRKNVLYRIYEPIIFLQFAKEIDKLRNQYAWVLEDMMLLLLFDE